MTPERFAQGMTFDDYVKFTGSPENLAREGFDIRRFSLVAPAPGLERLPPQAPRGARLTPDQIAAIQWLAAQPGGPAKVAVISEDWSSDCRRDVPYLARLAKAGGLELRIFTRDGDTMLLQGPARPGVGRQRAIWCSAYANEKNGQRWASVPVAVFFTEDFVELYRYIEYPADLPQGARDRPPARGAPRRDPGGGEGARRRRDRRPARVALLRRVGAGRDRRDPQRAARAPADPLGSGSPGVEEPHRGRDRDQQRDVGGPARQPGLARDLDAVLLPRDRVAPGEVAAGVALERLGHPRRAAARDPGCGSAGPASPPAGTGRSRSARSRWPADTSRRRCRGWPARCGRRRATPAPWRWSARRAARTRCRGCVRSSSIAASTSAAARARARRGS